MDCRSKLKGVWHDWTGATLKVTWQFYGGKFLILASLISIGRHNCSKGLPLVPFWKTGASWSLALWGWLHRISTLGNASRQNWPNQTMYFALICWLMIPEIDLSTVSSWSGTNPRLEFILRRINPCLGFMKADSDSGCANTYLRRINPGLGFIESGCTNITD